MIEVKLTGHEREYDLGLHIGIFWGNDSATPF